MKKSKYVNPIIAIALILGAIHEIDTRLRDFHPEIAIRRYKHLRGLYVEKVLAIKEEYGI